MIKPSSARWLTLALVLTAPKAHGDASAVTQDMLTSIVKRYTAEWNAAHSEAPLWVVGAEPGDPINIPGVAFGARGDLHAGMHVAIRANLIVLNQKMKPESLLTTFLHEYGHAKFRLTHKEPLNVPESERHAIRFSLEALATEGLPDLAREEARAVVEMSKAEPYATALKLLAKDASWVKYKP